MLFLVELDHVKSGRPSTPEANRAFIEQIILPTLARAEQLTKEEKIMAGGPAAGRIALRFIVETDSLQDVDRIVSSLPIGPVAETRITPLIAFADRRNSVQALLEKLASDHLSRWPGSRPGELMRQAEGLAQWWTALANCGSREKYEFKTEGLSKTYVQQVPGDLAPFKRTWRGI